MTVEVKPKVWENSNFTIHGDLCSKEKCKGETPYPSPPPPSSLNGCEVKSDPKMENDRSPKPHKGEYKKDHGGAQRNSMFAPPSK
ncbi:hypothetical protein TNCV_2730881 [Trichonephila clavipes]|nr:hypothetical protein TNCV_2730881 [Trichonephila clavipes]